MTRASAWSLNAVPEVEKSESERHLKDSKSAGLINTLGWSVVVWSCHVSKVSKCVNSFRQRSAWLDRFTESPRRSHAEHAFSVGVPSWVAEPSASLWTWKKTAWTVSTSRCQGATLIKRDSEDLRCKNSSKSWINHEPSSFIIIESSTFSSIFSPVYIPLGQAAPVALVVAQEARLVAQSSRSMQVPNSPNSRVVF